MHAPRPAELAAGEGDGQAVGRPVGTAWISARQLAARMSTGAWYPKGDPPQSTRFMSFVARLARPAPPHEEPVKDALLRGQGIKVIETAELATGPRRPSAMNA